MNVKPLEEIKEFCRNIAEKIGVSVVDAEFKGGDYPSITIYIDKKGGVDLDTCEKVSKLLDQPFDELDPTFGEPYSLNVSSVGIDRPFKTDEDFYSHIGELVEVRLKNSVKGKKFFDGELLSYDKKAITVKTDEKTALTFDLKNVVKVNEYIDFE